MNDRGFEIVEGVLTSEACDDALEAVRRAGRARNLMRVPEVGSLARSPRVLDIARRWVGPYAAPFRATLFDKSGLRNWFVIWHQDTTLPVESRADGEGWGPWSVKGGILHVRAPARALDRIVALRIHLDASTEDNGPLRVVPGSHVLGVLGSDEALEAAKRRPPESCLVGRGGGLAMRPLLVHASSRAESSRPRRVLHVEYADSLDLAPGLRLAIA